MIIIDILRNILAFSVVVVLFILFIGLVIGLPILALVYLEDYNNTVKIIGTLLAGSIIPGIMITISENKQKGLL